MADLNSWAVPRLARLLPLDDQSLQEIVAYSASLSKEAGAEHLKNLLGDSQAALDFISSFSARRPETTYSGGRNVPRTSQDAPGNAHSADGTNDSLPRRKGPKKSKVPLHGAGPVRQVEGHGNLEGGYQKNRTDGTYTSGAQNTATPAVMVNDAPSQPHAQDLSRFPEAIQQPKATQGLFSPSPSSSRDVSPSQRPGSKLPPSAAGNLVSDMLLPNVRSKQSKKPMKSQLQSGTSTPLTGSASPHGRGSKSTTTTTTSNIADITAAIAALEMSTNPSLSSTATRRRCDCNASLHPLFSTAPNCLGCGKIICALEGLQPCSFCNAPILNKEQANGMIQTLKQERGVERMATHNAGVSLSGRGTPMLGSTPMSSTPETSGDEGSVPTTAAARARAHRDKLLGFQRENAQRTKIHDEAADYDITSGGKTTQWMTPVQRAAALKKQQKYMRELQEANKPEWEKTKTVMSMSVRNGKLVKTYEKQKNAIPDQADTDADDHDVEGGDEQVLSTGGTGAFRKNPLLVSGHLVRPVWKSKEGVQEMDGDEPNKSQRTQKSVWRRVQDDNEDNEQWILDGGLLGHGREARLMEDGSQQECG